MGEAPEKSDEEEEASSTQRGPTGAEQEITRTDPFGGGYTDAIRK